MRSFQNAIHRIQHDKPCQCVDFTRAKKKPNTKMRRRFAALAKYLRDTGRRRCEFLEGMKHLAETAPELIVNYDRLLHEVDGNLDTLIRVYCENGVTYIELL